jgi:hypothetical protein
VLIAGFERDVDRGLVPAQHILGMQRLLERRLEPGLVEAVGQAGVGASYEPRRHSDEFTRDIRGRAAELAAERNAKIAELRELKATQPATPSPELLDLIPQAEIDFERIPEPILRQLYEAFRLEIVYDKETDTAECRVTLIPESIPGQHQATREVIQSGGLTPETKNRDHVIPILQPFGQYPQRGGSQMAATPLVGVPRRQLLIAGRFGIEPSVYGGT